MPQPQNQRHPYEGVRNYIERKIEIEFGLGHGFAMAYPFFRHLAEKVQLRGND